MSDQHEDEAMKLFAFLPVPLLAIAACEEAPPAPTLKQVPAAYVGTWDTSQADCAAGGGPQAITVAASEIIFPDSRLDVTGVAPDGDTAARIDGHFTTSQADWNGSVRLELAEAGRVLNAVTGSAVVPRVKCP
ncbi:MAG: hypothetical protein R3C46_01375 [Hyphomonadaceae bacterium]